MKTKAELDAAMEQAGFRFDPTTGGYRRGEFWLSAAQAREALGAAEAGETWVEDDVEPLSETLARTLTKAGIS